MRADDADIDAMMRGTVPVPVPARVEPVRAGRARRQHPVAPVEASRFRAAKAVAELSGELVQELKRNARPIPLAGEALQAVIAQHLAPLAAGESDVRPVATLIDVSPDDYHALPGLSSTTAKTIVSRSPAHARAEHQAFGGRGKDPTKPMDRGSVVHALVLGKGKQFSVVDAGDWRTKVAREQRVAARDSGLVPILRHELDAAEVIAEQIKLQLPEHGVRLDGESEVAIGWWEETEHGYVRCRAMLDHVHLDAGVILDLKIVENAAPDAIERSAENLGYGIQDAAYRRALSRLRPALAGRVDMLFAFSEAEPPYAVNVVRGDGVFRELGERRWDRAVAIWARSLRENRWPSYGAGINPITAPLWALRKEGLLDS